MIIKYKVIRKVLDLSTINDIEQKIKQLDGGAFQNLFDTYLKEKYSFSNINTLGSHDGSNKVTKGTPDTYVINDDATYTLIMYGTTETNPYGKIKKDILDCLNYGKVGIPKDKIKKIICGYCSSNFSIEQTEELINLTNGINLELISLSTIAFDLYCSYQYIAYDFLGISIDTRQIYTPDLFIAASDKSRTSSPLNIEFLYRENELKAIRDSISKNRVTVVIGNAGVGKTKTVLESLKTPIFEGYKIYCVKNNGALLSTDINRYFSEEGNYILFLDDANETAGFRQIIDFVCNPPSKINISLVITVRSYAKQKITNEIKKYFVPQIIKIGEFTDIEIEGILKSVLKIKNETYLRKISEIANGNIRIAILSGLIAINGNFNDIENVQEVFHVYYSPIISEKNFDKNKILSIFIIALLYPLDIFENNELKMCLQLFSIDENNFREICYELNKEEIIDLLDNKIAKIADQSFKDYILYHVIIDKKYIPFYQLLDTLFIFIPNKIVKVVNSLFSIFYSKKVYNYVKNQVLLSWRSTQDENKELYIQKFYAFNENEALLYIKNKIQNIDERPFNIDEVDIDEVLRVGNSTEFEITVLSSFKQSINYMSAFELLLLLFNKNLDSAKNVIRVICKNFLYDKNSFYDDYIKEKVILEKLWENSDKGNNYNITVVLLEVIKILLQVESGIIEQGRSVKTINFIRIKTKLTDGNRELRKLLWKILAELYKNKGYEEKIDDILNAYDIYSTDKTEQVAYIKYDMQCIADEFSFDDISFKNAIILHHFECILARNNIVLPNFITNKNKNELFSIIEMFLENIYRSSDVIKNKLEKTEKISKMLEKFNFNDYKKLFSACSQYEKLNLKNGYILSDGLKIVFEKLKETPSLFIEIVKLYINNNSPYFLYIGRDILYVLLDFIGPEETKKIIDNTEGYIRSVYFKFFYTFFPENDINQSVCDDLYEFISKEMQNKQKLILDVFSLSKFKKIDYDIVSKITKIIIKEKDISELLIREYINEYITEEIANKLLELFDNDIELLMEVYFKQICNSVDFQGILFEKLFEKIPNFWKVFCEKILELRNIQKASISEIFVKIWKLQNYKEYIDLIFNMIINKDGYIYKHSLMSSIFIGEVNIEDQLFLNQRNWIKNYIEQNYNSLENIRQIFEVINDYFEKDKIEYFSLFLSLNKDFEFFKKIPLLSWNYSWSGSEIPLIEKRINFLNDLLFILKGYDFLEHRNFVIKNIENEKQNLQNEIQWEFIENYDI